MPPRPAKILANPADLTPYAVANESWITDGYGHSALRVPAKDGEESNKIDLHPRQADYLIHSGQVKPIPGVTKGYPADAVTGEALDISAEDRARVEAQPSINADEEGTLVEGQGFSSSDEIKAPADDPGLSEPVKTDEAAKQPEAQEALAPPTAPTKRRR